eukprot:scaffold71219_cov39-Phaeocystis_antarctica.AAC.1
MPRNLRVCLRRHRRAGGRLVLCRAAPRCALGRLRWDQPGATVRGGQSARPNTLTLTLDLSPAPTRTLTLTLTQPLTLTRCSLATAPALSSAREARLRHSATSRRSRSRRARGAPAAEPACRVG